jgi:hypothetical protein
LPVDWLREEHGPFVTELVRHVCGADEIGELIAASDRTADIGRYDKLFRLGLPRIPALLRSAGR